MTDSDRGDTVLDDENEDAIAAAREAEIAAEAPKEAPPAEEVAEETPAEEVEAKPRDEKGKFIPKERFDEINTRAKEREAALSSRIQELEKARVETQTDVNLAALEARLKELDDKYDDEVTDGEKDKAKATKLEIRHLEQIRNRTEASLYSQRAQINAVEQYRYDNALSQAEATYPGLNPDAEEFDESATSEVADLMDSFIARGNTRADALRRAVKYVMGAPLVKTDNSKGDEVRNQRAEDARRKANTANGKQPARLDKGTDSDKLGGQGLGKDVMKMTQDQFSKLDDDTKARMRGDAF